MQHWRHSFVTRVSALFALLIVALVVMSAWLRDRASRTQFLQDQRRHLANRVEVIRLRTQSEIDAVRKDILYLSRAPAIARLAASRGDPEREAAVHFKALLEVRPTYF